MKILVTGGSGFIGHYLCESLIKKGHNVVNVDIEGPTTHSDNDKFEWLECNILDRNKVNSIFREFEPEIVYHLAAKADVFGKTLADYRMNIEGTANILAACNALATVKHVIVTSTQLVIKPDFIPKAIDDYAPLDQLYSLSKVKTEELTRQKSFSFNWTIIRPTNIWGPRHPRFPNEIWKYIEKGWYFQSSKDVKRSYGYVENIVYQMLKIIEVDPEQVNSKTFYVGDEPVYSLEWVDGFSYALRGKKSITLPNYLFKATALFGEILNKLGLPAPIHMDRYRSMTTEYTVPMEDTFNVLGKGPYSLKEGIAITVRSLKNEK